MGSLIVGLSTGYEDLLVTLVSVYDEPVVYLKADVSKRAIILSKPGDWPMVCFMVGLANG